MTAVGDRVPDVKVFTFGDKGPEAATSAEVLGKGKVVLFGVPGAFTPTCSDHHLPGFVFARRGAARQRRGQGGLRLGERPVRHGRMGQGPEGR